MSVPTKDQQEKFALAKHYRKVSQKPGKSEGEKLTLLNMANCLITKVNKIV